MWLYNWFKSTLENRGLISKNVNVIFLGLEDAGKTTLTLRLKDDILKPINSNYPPYFEEFSMDNIRFKVWDLGSYVTYKKTWRNYLTNVDGIIYVVDASNHKRFQQNRIQIQGILQIPEFQKIPFVILGNKIDKVGAVQQDQLRKVLGIQEKSVGQWNETKSARPIGVFMCSVARKIGYGNGFKWLCNYLK